jgi:Spy/CpxP family protein refolding chaperone
MKSTAHLRWLFAFLFLLLLAMSPTSAQGFKWWNSDQYRHELGLTGEQSRRLEDIFQAALPGLRAAKKSLDTAEAEFESLVRGGDDAAVMAQVDRVESARAELNKTRTKMLLKMRRALTTDQWVKLGALERERRAADAAKNANNPSAPKDRAPAK